MPDLLALEWDHDQVAGVAAEFDGGRVTVRQIFTLPRKFSGGDLPPNDWLRGELNRLEVAVPAETLVSIPRDDAFLRRLELPEAPPEELPGMVRFQVGAKSSVAIDEQSLDFLPLRRHGDIPGCDVLAATAPLTLLETIRVQVVAAGSTLRFAGLSPALCAEWIARAESQLTGGREGISLLVSRHVPGWKFPLFAPACCCSRTRPDWLETREESISQSCLRSAGRWLRCGRRWPMRSSTGPGCWFLRPTSKFWARRSSAGWGVNASH